MILQKDCFAFCFLSISPVRAEAKDESEIVTQLLFGEPVKVIKLHENWAQIAMCDFLELEGITVNELRQQFGNYLKNKDI